ncbi:MFS transporter [Pontibacter beigongshangensis]|uniref:MFS transporter n=1 Tax=Pontibacter beigongshangensis TaxID=2574733 RepID=UPI0016504E46|nr:MFS transporter [Pontibacter beigongshangensis]
MKKILLLYRNAYGGLSRPAWMMSLVMLINRCGAMVTPFLGVYLIGELGYSLKEAGAILSIYGLGSVCGSFLGGWLTDRIGHFRVQFVALTLGGSLYFLLLNLRQFEYLAVGVFMLSLVNDCLRPANSASIAHYAKPENMTRAFSLNRMAINLGFSVGPALGGLLAALSYRWLFIADGITCIGAGIFFYLYFRQKPSNRPQPPVQEIATANPGKSPYTDLLFLLFVLFCCVFATVFFQLLSTLPLYYKQVYQLTEGKIGLLMGLNGMIVFLLEMILVYLLGERFPRKYVVAAGVLLVGLSFISLNLMAHGSILIISMLLLSISEILAMPYMTTLTVERSDASTRGAYMGLYTISYSAAHVVAPLLGTSIISAFGFSTLWWTSGGLAAVAAAGLYLVVQAMEKQWKKNQHLAKPTVDGLAIGSAAGAEEVSEGLF